MKTFDKGSLGEFSVMKELQKQGFLPFKPMGDGSRVDLVAMSQDGKLYKLQIKYTKTKNGCAHLALRKRNQKFTYYYNSTDVDVYALYVEDMDIVLFMSSDEAFDSRDKVSSISFRFVPSKNNQKCRQAENYHLFPACLNGRGGGN